MKKGYLHIFVFIVLSINIIQQNIRIGNKKFDSKTEKSKFANTMFYYINNLSQVSGEHEVHTKDCEYLPDEENQIELGEFNNCSEAIANAKEKFPDADIDGCRHCCPDCHKK